MRCKRGDAGAAQGRWAREKAPETNQGGVRKVARSGRGRRGSSSPEAAILLCRVEKGTHRGTPSLSFPGQGEVQGW